jgi:hypothetical protein
MFFELRAAASIAPLTALLLAVCVRVETPDDRRASDHCGMSRGRIRRVADGGSHCG